jgi:hypothetical protein
MKKIYSSIVSLIVPAIIFCQMVRPQETLLVGSWGESNEPGYAREYFYSSAEKAVRRARMFDINTEKYARLRFGVNNLGTWDTTGSYEIALANAYDNGDFGNYNLYITKTGQGSTRVHDWMPGGTLYERFIYRMDLSLALIAEERNVTPTQVCLISLGINDMFAGLSAANFKDSIDIVLDELHDYYPAMKFVFTKFNQGAYTGYNTTFDDIVSERSDYVFTIYNASAALMGDNTHWNEAGWETLVNGTSGFTSIIQSILNE